MSFGKNRDESAPSTRFLVAAIFLGAVIVVGSLFLGDQWSFSQSGAAEGSSDSHGARQLSLVSKVPEEPAGSEKPKKDFLPVYGLDSSVNQEEINFYVAVQHSASVEDKLNKLADRLSRFRFDHHPVEVKGIGSQEGRTVAVIDLREPAGDAYGWRTGYFQGSAGAHATQTTLTKTFAQPDYSGEWVDGVKFLYEGEPIGEADWSHMSLSGIFWQQDMSAERP